MTETQSTNMFAPNYFAPSNPFITTPTYNIPSGYTLIPGTQYASNPSTGGFIDVIKQQSVLPPSGITAQQNIFGGASSGAGISSSNLFYNAATGQWISNPFRPEPIQQTQSIAPTTTAPIRQEGVGTITQPLNPSATPENWAMRQSQYEGRPVAWEGIMATWGGGGTPYSVAPSSALTQSMMPTLTTTYSTGEVSTQKISGREAQNLLMTGQSIWNAPIQPTSEIVQQDAAFANFPAFQAHYYFTKTFTGLNPFDWTPGEWTGITLLKGSIAGWQEIISKALGQPGGQVASFYKEQEEFRKQYAEYTRTYGILPSMVSGGIGAVVLASGAILSKSTSLVKFGETHPLWTFGAKGAAAFGGGVFGAKGIEEIKSFAQAPLYYSEAGTLATGIIDIALASSMIKWSTGIGTEKITMKTPTEERTILRELYMKPLGKVNPLVGIGEGKLYVASLPEFSKGIAGTQFFGTGSGAVLGEMYMRSQYAPKALTKEFIPDILAKGKELRFEKMKPITQELSKVPLEGMTEEEIGFINEQLVKESEGWFLRSLKEEYGSHSLSYYFQESPEELLGRTGAGKADIDLMFQRLTTEGVEQRWVEGLNKISPGQWSISEAEPGIIQKTIKNVPTKKFDIHNILSGLEGTSEGSFGISYKDVLGKVGDVREMTPGSTMMRKIGGSLVPTWTEEGKLIVSPEIGREKHLSDALALIKGISEKVGKKGGAETSTRLTNIYEEATGIKVGISKLSDIKSYPSSASLPSIVAFPRTSPVIKSPSSSARISPSISPSLSLSVSISPSKYPSLSPSLFKSPSRSISKSPSLSPSLSPSFSPSLSPLISPSLSPSPSRSPSPSHISSPPSLTPIEMTPSFGFDERQFRRMSKIDLSTRYKPSLAAIGEGIFAAGKTPKLVSGFGLRPIYRRKKR